MAKKPHPSKLASSRSSNLELIYSNLITSLSQDGETTLLRTFESVIRKGCPAINMTLAGCIRFLESGRWLNVYEAIAVKTGVSNGPTFEQALREKLGIWYEARTDFDRILGFRTDTHYAALNIGGCGPDYGECCVRFGREARLRSATCFAGDTLQVVFDDQGKQILSEDEILARFSAYPDRVQLAAVHVFTSMRRSRILDTEELISILDDRETLIEVHIHGPVMREHVIDITLRSEFFDSVARRCIEFENSLPHEKQAKQFTKVRLMKRLLQLVDIYGLQLKAKR